VKKPPSQVEIGRKKREESLGRGGSGVLWKKRTKDLGRGSEVPIASRKKTKPRREEQRKTTIVKIRSETGRRGGQSPHKGGGIAESNIKG